jgi:hypothetical protein
MHTSEGSMLLFLTNLPPDTCMSHGIIDTTFMCIASYDTAYSDCLIWGVYALCNSVQ